MILESKNTTFAFRCPICGKAILSGVNIFRLSADMLRLKCPDCDTSLTACKTNEGKFRLTVPCLFCPRPHSFVLGGSTIFSGELFSLPCGLSGMNILYMGEQEAVQNAMVNDEKALLEMLDEEDREALSRLHSEPLEEPTDPGVEHVVRFLLCELEDEKKISCYCDGKEEIPLYDFQILSERVRIFCHCCNAETYLPLRSEADAERFIRIDSLELK